MFINLSNHYLFFCESRKRAGGLHWPACLGGREATLGTYAPDGANKAGPWSVYPSRMLTPASVRTVHWRGQHQQQGDQSGVQESRGEARRNMKGDARRGQV